MKIHPSAIVDPKAELAADVEIGPYVVIAGNVKIGEGTIVRSRVTIDPFVTLGRRNFIGPGTILGGAPQDLSFSEDRKTFVVIGDDNVIREHCTIHRGSAEGSSTTLGHKNFLMVGAHLGHNCAVGNNVIIANN